MQGKDKRHNMNQYLTDFNKKQIKQHANNKITITLGTPSTLVSSTR